MEDNILSEEFLKKYENRQPVWGFNGLGYVVYKRCVTVETPVLCEDMVWRPAGDLKKGDKIIAFEEGSLNRREYGFKGRPRHIIPAHITHNEIETANVVKITLENGEILYSTPDHSWLVNTVYGLEWVEAKDLIKNNAYFVKYSDVWTQDTSYEAGYLAAAFDGEGSLDRKRALQFTQTNNVMLKKVVEYLDKRGYKYSIVQKSSQKKNSKSFKSTKPCYQLSIYGNGQVMRFLGEIRPKRLLEKYMNTIDPMALRRKNKNNTYIKVISVEDAGKKKIAVMSTSSKTHFTAGYPSHNTYARPVVGEDRTEEWAETVERCIRGAQKIGARYTKEEAERLFDHVFNLRCNFAGRALWQLGTPTVDKLGVNSLINCFFTNIKEYKDFLFLFENSMLGGGVGFSIKREDVHEFPRVKSDVVITHKNTKDADFIVPDSREGWSELLRKVFKSYFETGKSFSYSTILIRGAGEKITTFGGVASGPQILIEGVENISKVLGERGGKKIRSIDALDICNILGKIVVSGNVRRSAEIALGDVDDVAFLKAKRWDTGTIPNWRAMSNNSVYCNDIDHLLNAFWDGYDGNGEPYGLVNIKLSKKFGRLGEENFDATGEGTNPCAEIVALADKETCNLSEIYLNNISSKEEMADCAKLLYKYQKAVCAMKFYHDDTTNIVRKNMRIGVGVTGICQKPLARTEKWFDFVYLELKKLDKEWSKKNGYNESIRLTTVKPSGTLSLLSGSTPGVHPAYSKYFIRRVRMAATDKLVEYCRERGFHVEFQLNFDGTEDHNTVVVEFPCHAGDDAIIAKEMSAIKQLELVKEMQKEWADNSVSVTVYYKKEELPEIKEWLKNNYNSNIKTVSFLLHNEHGFKQAPYEEITKEKYDQLRKKVKTIDVFKKNTMIDVVDGSMECSTGACPLR